MRRHPFAKWVVGVASVLVLCWGFSPGCRVNPETGETEVHWPSVAAELSLIAEDLDDAASIADADDAAVLGDLSALVRQVGYAVAEGGPDADVLGLIDAALGRADDLWLAVSGDQAPEDVRVAVLLLRSTLRRVRLYAAG